MPSDTDPSLKPGAIEALLDTDHVTPPTRRALRERLDWSPDGRARSLQPDAFATLSAVCDRLIPQDGEDRCVPVAARLDERLAQGGGDGWRYDVLPPDPIATALGLEGIEQAATILFSGPFTTLEGVQQDAVLRHVQTGSPPGEVWGRLNARLFFTDLLAQVVELYYAHPYAQAQIGYLGMADAQGFHTLGLNRRDPIEDEATNAPL